MNRALVTVLSLCISTAASFPWHHGPDHHGGNSQSWDLKNFSTLISFGDSYSDTGRLTALVINNGTLPPGYTDDPPSNAFGNGYAWPTYVSWYTGARLYNYAVSGAACSNDITPRYLAPLDGDNPDIQYYEIPAWLNDTQYVDENGTKFMQAPVDETVYSMWIGTNDLDVGEMLTDSQTPGTNITTFIDCVYDQLQRIYDAGGRYFVLQNILPLFLTPLVATPENGGVGSNHYWPDKPSNLTAISYKMLQMVVTTNAIFEYRTPFELLVARRFPGAQFALMDMYGLIEDIWHNPSQYLNGSAPLNVTGFISHCPLNATDVSVCEQLPSPDSYLWYDESHPSQQTDRIIAREFVEVVKGGSRWATYWSS